MTPYIELNAVTLVTIIFFMGVDIIVGTITIIIIVIMSITVMIGSNALAVVADAENGLQTIDQGPSLGRVQTVEIVLSPAYGG